MAPLHSRIFTMLDHEFIEYFETYERLRSLRASLHSSLESGWFELARARCSSGKFSSIGASTLCPQSDTPSQWLMYTNHNHINLRCKDSMPHPSSFLYSSTELESSDRQDLPSHLVLHRARIDVPEGKETESSKAMIKRRNNATIQAPDGDTRNSREVAAASGSTKPSSSSSSDLCLPRYYGMRASAPLRTCQKSFVRGNDHDLIPDHFNVHYFLLIISITL